LGAVLLTSAGASASDAQDPPPRERERIIPYRAVEAQGIAMLQLLPRATYGIDGAFVFGWPSFQVRVGGMFAGTPPFRMGQGRLANILAVGEIDLCVGRDVIKHQIRMCAGAQAGGMKHRWLDYERPGRDATPFAAGTLRGDYRFAVTERIGILGGAGVVVPFVGPSFRAYDQFGVPTPMIFPGPVAGFLSLGTSYRW